MESATLLTVVGVPPIRVSQIRALKMKQNYPDLKKTVQKACGSDTET